MPADRKPARLPGDRRRSFNDRRSNVLPFGGTESGRAKLFTATVVATEGRETVQAFHASLATGAAEVVERLRDPLRDRLGGLADGAVVVDGFDPSEPLVAALVPEAICDSLLDCLADPESLIAAGLDLNIEQRSVD